MTELTKQEVENYKKAGQIAKQIKEYAKQIIKPDMLLRDIAEKIEAKILELGGEIAFPVNLCIDEIAAHFTPNLDDTTKAHGLLKIDLGIHIKGCVADTAFSIDLTENQEHKNMIKANEQALENAQKEILKTSSKTPLNKIGEIIHKTTTEKGFSPIRNLSGHGLEEYEVHSGITIPNYDNGNKNEIEQGAFAIEPFATSGSGIVYESISSNIYHLIKQSPVRDSLARQIFDFVLEKKKTLPFSQREIEKKFGSRARIGLRLLEQAGAIASYPRLIEKSHKPVSQAENTIIIYKDKAEILT